MHYSLNFPDLNTMEIIQLEWLKSTLAVNESIYMTVGVHVHTVSTTDRYTFVVDYLDFCDGLSTICNETWYGDLCHPLPVTYGTKLYCPGVVCKLKKLNIWHFEKV